MRMDYVIRLCVDRVLLTVMNRSFDHYALFSTVSPAMNRSLYVYEYTMDRMIIYWLQSYKYKLSEARKYYHNEVEEYEKSDHSIVSWYNREGSDIISMQIVDSLSDLVVMAIGVLIEVRDSYYPLYIYWQSNVYYFYNCRSHRIMNNKQKWKRGIFYLTSFLLYFTFFYILFYFMVYYCGVPWLW